MIHAWFFLGPQRKATCVLCFFVIQSFNAHKDIHMDCVQYFYLSIYVDSNDVLRFGLNIMNVFCFDFQYADGTNLKPSNGARSFCFLKEKLK